MPMIDALWPQDAMTPKAKARLVKERAGESQPDARGGRLARARFEKTRITLEAALDAARAGMTSKP